MQTPATSRPSPPLPPSSTSASPVWFLCALHKRPQVRRLPQVSGNPAITDSLAVPCPVKAGSPWCCATISSCFAIANLTDYSQRHGARVSPAPAGGAAADAEAALTGLGFRPAEASAAVRAAEEELGPDAGLDALVRLALRKAAR